MDLLSSVQSLHRHVGGRRPLASSALQASNTTEFPLLQEGFVNQIHSLRLLHLDVASPLISVLHFPQVSLEILPTDRFRGRRLRNCEILEQILMYGDVSSHLLVGWMLSHHVQARLRLIPIHAFTGFD